MKMTLRFELPHSMAACMALLFLGVSATLGNETNNPTNPPNDPANPHIIVLDKEEYARFMAAAETNPPPLRPDIKWGEATNGLKCGITLKMWPEVWVFIETPLTNIPYPNLSLANTNAAIPPKGFIYADASPWLGAPNGFFGPMGLRNAKGKQIPLLKPEANNPVFYPEFLRWSVLQPKIGSGGGCPTGPHVGQWGVFMKYKNVQQASGLLPQFKDIFEVNEPGQYQLTLWPKIYKRSEKPGEDHDVFQRIDLPPVSITIKLAGNSSNQ